jgi:hypothetical protein
MGINTPQTFTVTDEHLHLLQRTQIRYNADIEFGAPEVDPKRPYGNSNVIADIAEILGWMDESWWDGDQDIPAEWVVNGNRIHREMEIVLQILVRNLCIMPGEYQTTKSYTVDWYKV